MNRIVELDFRHLFRNPSYVDLAAYVVVIDRNLGRFIEQAIDSYIFSLQVNPETAQTRERREGQYRHLGGLITEMPHVLSELLGEHILQGGEPFH